MLAYIDPKVHEYVTADNQRSAVAGALYDVANEHGKGVCTLFENQHYASGFALVRSLFETFVRGAWLLHCASEKEFETFTTKDRIELETKENFNFGDMLISVETKLELPGALTSIKEESWKALNSYTHGGLFQVSRRYDGVTVEPHHDPGQIDEIVRFSALIVFLVFCEFSRISETQEMDEAVEELYNQISGPAKAGSLS
jgi:hypothetical protein